MWRRLRLAQRAELGAAAANGLWLALRPRPLAAAAVPRAAARPVPRWRRRRQLGKPRVFRGVDRKRAVPVDKLLPLRRLLRPSRPGAVLHLAICARLRSIYSGGNQIGSGRMLHRDRREQLVGLGGPMGQSRVRLLQQRVVQEQDVPAVVQPAAVCDLPGKVFAPRHSLPPVHHHHLRAPAVTVALAAAELLFQVFRRQCGLGMPPQLGRRAQPALARPVGEVLDEDGAGDALALQHEVDDPAEVLERGPDPLGAQLLERQLLPRAAELALEELAVFLPLLVDVLELRHELAVHRVDAPGLALDRPRTGCADLLHFHLELLVLQLDVLEALDLLAVLITNVPHKRRVVRHEGVRVILRIDFQAVEPVIKRPQQVRVVGLIRLAPLHHLHVQLLQGLNIFFRVVKLDLHRRER
mmetsp:Transcript_70582/g.199268  ORF Transcript_70582/g.199268 Transcript_70582/m.199268 type:complete len:412 (+) Transcript_70582:201-1436(+)